MRKLRSIFGRQVTHVFVCGCGHSGTTLITKMLGRHSEIYSIPYETELFLDNKPCESSLIAFDAEFKSLLAEKGARILCEKTPRHIRCLNVIRQVFPGCVFVIPVRDARDVALSIKLRTGSLSEGYERWRLDNRLVRSELQHNAKDLLVFKYELLIEDTAKVLEKICKKIGLKFELEMLKFQRDQRRWFLLDNNTEAEPRPQQHEEFRDWQVRQPLMDRRDRWKHLLTQKEILEIEEYCGDEMQYFGY